MPLRTLRDYLKIPNPKLKLMSNVTFSTREPSDHWPTIDRWQQWEDFKMENVEKLFGPFLDTKFDLADPPPLPEIQRHVRDERSFEFILSRWNNVIVNEALRAASEHLGLERVVWVVGSLVLPSDEDTDSIMRPDWAGVTSEMVTDLNRWSSLVPGDTKFIETEFKTSNPASKGKRRIVDEDSFLGSSPAMAEQRHLRSCLEQVNYYAFLYQSRYCYIITNHELLIVRRIADLPLSVSKSIAQTRERRLPQARQLTPTPGPSLPSSSFQIDSSPPSVKLGFSSSPYTDHGRPEMNMANPDILAIPWDSGEDGLTINLALFVLHMLAALACDVRDEYPNLDQDPDYITKLNHRESRKS